MNQILHERRQQGILATHCRTGQDSFYNTDPVKSLRVFSPQAWLVFSPYIHLTQACISSFALHSDFRTTQTIANSASLEIHIFFLHCIINRKRRMQNPVWFVTNSLCALFSTSNAQPLAVHCSWFLVSFMGRNAVSS